eukprot:FR740094.1.p2 GENE.FR740094.1~~FR740094.1.p2  ORF type:complete len:116 (-),score=27.94 FR740094.1:745-1092(-)
MTGGARTRGFPRAGERAGPGRRKSQFNVGFSSTPLGPPPGFFPFLVSGFGSLGGIWEPDNKFPTRKQVMPMIYAKGGNLTFIKGNKSWSSHRGGGRSRTSGSPWFWTLAVTHCGR